MDKGLDIITVPLSPIDGSPVFQVPNYKNQRRYLPTVTMLVSILSYQHHLRESCFLQGKWKAEAELGVDAELPLVEVELRELVKDVVNGTRAASTTCKKSGRVANLESIITGTAGEVDRLDVPRIVGKYLERTCVRVSTLDNFFARHWENITKETSTEFIIVANPCKIPVTVEHMHSPHPSWKLVYAAESSGSGDGASSTAPNIAFANVNEEMTLWTTVQKGVQKRRILPGNMLQVLRAADVYIYKRLVNAKEVYRGKMVNFLGQQMKVCCDLHKSPLVKMGRLDEVCSRRSCENKATYRCRELDEEQNECRIFLCRKHFKEVNSRQGEQVLVKWESKAPRRPAESNYRVVLTVPPPGDFNDQAQQNSSPISDDMLDDVQPAVMTAREARFLEDFVGRLQGACGDGDGLVCEMAPDAENPLSALFPNPDKQNGMYFFNW
jgi:hypothetical protein